MLRPISSVPGQMNGFRIASLTDLARVATWISSLELCTLWAGGTVSFPIQLDRLTEEVDFRNSESWCLFLDGDLVGFGQIMPMADARQHLTRIIVDPKFRGRGLGRHLTKHLLDQAYAKSPSSVSLNVNLQNQAAVKMYRKLGFCGADRDDSEPRSSVEHMVHAV